MKNHINSVAEISLKDFPVSFNVLFTDALDEKHFTNKLKARKRLVGMGKTILPQIHKLLTSGNGTLRREATKIVELIADPKSIPFLINMLDDIEFDIRWIAAEGLIKIGRRSIIPQLMALRDGKSSLFMDEGAHHVLNGLLFKNEKEELIPLMRSLENLHELRETVPVEAYKALKTVFRSKTGI